MGVGGDVMAAPCPRTRLTNGGPALSAQGSADVVLVERHDPGAPLVDESVAW